ncbi:MAG: hypothetical protein ACP5RK_02645 [Candidatus Micrarchaeia archaeon]
MAIKLVAKQTNKVIDGQNLHTGHNEYNRSPLINLKREEHAKEKSNPLAVFSLLAGTVAFAASYASIILIGTGIITASAFAPAVCLGIIAIALVIGSGYSLSKDYAKVIK